MKNDDNLIKWNKKKKDERDKAREAEHAKAKVATVYSSWKIELCKRARSRREIIAAFYKLKDSLLAERDYFQDIGGFPVDKTVDIIDQHIATLTTIAITEKNTIKSHVPVTHATTGARPKTAQFRTIKEFNEIDFVKHFSMQPGFKGFSVKMQIDGKGMDIVYYVLAHYNSGDNWLVGTLVNDVAVADFPSYDDVAISNEQPPDSQNSKPV